jgi:hypothetical protein
MKKYMISLITCVSILWITSGCEKGPHFKTLPFKAEFFTILQSFEEDGGCTPPRNYLNTQAGDGTATHLGGFSTTLTFCVNPATFEYENVQGSFVAENGDEIFVTGYGQVLPSTEPGYDLEFQDPFEIIGGTGKFAGATGSGTTNSFVNLTTQQTDHVWTGTITILK